MKGFSKKIKTLLSDDGGNVMIMVAAFLAMTIAIGGAAIDFGRAQLLQMKQQQAADNASLAAGNILNRNYNLDDNAAIREATARLYYNLNVPATYLGVDRANPTIQYLNDTRSVVINTSGQINTNFTSVNGGSNYVNVSSLSRVQVPQDNTPDFDAVLVVDLSSSTSRQPAGFNKNIINTEKDAIRTMVNAIFPESQATNLNVRFGLIGYSGPIVTAKPLTSTRATALDYLSDPLLTHWEQNFDHWGLEAAMKMLTGDWKGFTPPRHCSDSAVAAAKARTGIDFNGPRTPIDGCVNDPARQALGCSNNSQGFPWCPERNSAGLLCHNYKPHMTKCLPERNTDVPAPVTDRNDSEQLSGSRFIVLISDGAIMRDVGANSGPDISGFNRDRRRRGCHTDWNAYWRLAFPELPVNNMDMSYIEEGDTCDDGGGTLKNGANYQAFLRQCQAIKDAGIIIYTINFVQPAGVDYHTMRACASSENKSFYAPTEAELRNILSGIATQIQNIRIQD